MGWRWTDRLVDIRAAGRGGSGIVLGDRGVLTARHVVSDALNAPDTEPIMARIVDRRDGSVSGWVNLECVAEDDRLDLAVLEVDQEATWTPPTSERPVIVAVETVNTIDNREAAGFPDE